MTAGGWIFMGAAWTISTGLVVWCYARLLRGGGRLPSADEHDRPRDPL